MEEAVEEMFAGFAADRKTAGCVSMRGEAALDGLAYVGVFLLDSFASGDASRIWTTQEVKVEDHFRPVHAARQNEVGIHRVGIAIDHEIRIDPVVKSASVIAKRTPLQTVTIAEFDLVVRVIEKAV